MMWIERLIVYLLYTYVLDLMNLVKNSQAVKKGAAQFKNGQYKKSCEIQAGGQEMAVMVGWWHKF